MLAFEVHLNGKRLCTAGVGEPGVLTTVVTWVLGDGEGRAKGEEELDIRIGGLVSRTDQHLDWIAKQLQRGDEISIRIVEVSAADKAQKRRKESSAQKRKRQERYVRHMAKELGWRIETQN
jgi:hypothetical protein